MPDRTCREAAPLVHATRARPKHRRIRTPQREDNRDRAPADPGSGPLRIRRLLPGSSSTRIGGGTPSTRPHRGAEHRTPARRDHGHGFEEFHASLSDFDRGELRKIRVVPPGERLPQGGTHLNFSGRHRASSPPRGNAGRYERPHRLEAEGPYSRWTRLRAGVDDERGVEQDRSKRDAPPAPMMVNSRGSSGIRQVDLGPRAVPGDRDRLHRPLPALVSDREDESVRHSTRHRRIPRDPLPPHGDRPAQHRGLDRAPAFRARLNPPNRRAVPALGSRGGVPGSPRPAPDPQRAATEIRRRERAADADHVDGTDPP